MAMEHMQHRRIWDIWDHDNRSKRVRIIDFPRCCRNIRAAALDRATSVKSIEVGSLAASARILAATKEVSLALRKLLIGVAPVLMHCTK
jgi:hypothetical protein